MKFLPQLNLLERLALRLLMHSPRVSMLTAKTHGSEELAWCVSKSDETAVALLKNMLCSDDLEPASLLLERLYHAPSYGENE